MDRFDDCGWKNFRQRFDDFSYLASLENFKGFFLSKPFIMASYVEENFQSLFPTNHKK